MSELKKIEATVDKIACVGTAMCRSVAPEAFLQDPDGLTSVGDVSLHDLETLLDAAESCPVSAIKLFDAATGDVIAY
ncbi:hypothetical protein JCM18899A_31670 [Nocardioides sp. AN3]